jgi:hypothetical protein
VRLASAIARRDLVRENALAHEVVHFLQQEAYPQLFARVLEIQDSDDTSWAAQAAIEGDAVRYGFAALETAVTPPAPHDFHARLEAAVAESPLGREPALIREGILFPYGYGYRLAVLEATLLLDHPPASTEQALHGERRRAPFTLFDLSPLEPSVPGNCRPLWRNSLGELGMAILLRDLDPTSRPPAWEGWDGDRYVAARCGDAREFAWLTSWDSSIDAHEFAGAYRGVAARIAERAGLASAPAVEIRGSDAIVYTPRLARYARAELTGAGRRRVQSLEEVLAALSRDDPKRSGDGR